MLRINGLVVHDVVSIVEVWCRVQWSNAYSINMQFILQIINLLVDSFIISHVHNIQAMQLIQNQPDLTKENAKQVVKII